MKNKFNLFNIISVAYLLIIGFIVGYYISHNISKEINDPFIRIIISVILFYIAIFLQIIIHEMGHLIFGLLTGYKFTSFRVSNIILIKNENKFSIKRFSLAGTGGQCLLAPPERKEDGSYPYVLYHLGGVILNVITSIIFYSIYIFTPKNYFGLLLLLLSLMGILFAILNGIPFSSSIANDAQNLKSAKENPLAKSAMWYQLKINSLLANNIGLSEMPENYFELPEERDKHNIIISAIDVFKANRLMSKFEFIKAYNLIKDLLSDEYTIHPVYKFLLQIDKLTIDLMMQKENTDISILEDKEFKTYKKAMKKNPSITRLEYAIRQLKYGEDVLEEYKIKMLKIGEKYPYEKDIESEIILMDRIKEIYINNLVIE